MINTRNLHYHSSIIIHIIRIFYGFVSLGLYRAVVRWTIGSRRCRRRRNQIDGFCGCVVHTTDMVPFVSFRSEHGFQC